jgi:hypothetical protein
MCGSSKWIKWFLVYTRGVVLVMIDSFALQYDRGTSVADAPMGATTTMTWEELRKEARRCESACERELGELSAMGACARMRLRGRGDDDDDDDVRGMMRF